MKKVIAIGEALIDFIPHEKGRALNDVENFLRVPGGAPLNVAAAVAKLGGKSQMLTKLGQDGFGDAILNEVKPLGVDVSRISRTNEANTALAFVSLREDGERDFSFYRNPSADMLLSAEEICVEDFNEKDILHFCSVSLIDAPIKEAHRRAIEIAKEKGCLISFDPNVRLPLWKNPEDCRKAILEFLPLSNIVKISDEELEFITGIKDEKEALDFLLTGDVKVIIYTKGTNGAEFITKERVIFSPSFKVSAQDTTGAGDSFIGAFLFKLLENEVNLDGIDKLSCDTIRDYLLFANHYAAYSTTKKGAIASYANLEEIQEYIKNR